MSEKTYRVTNVHNVSWAVRFKTEEAAWGRILSTRNMIDTPANRAAMLREGWGVKTIEPPGYDLGGTDSP
jgi:hypothetical protein